MYVLTDMQLLLSNIQSRDVHVRSDVIAAPRHRMCYRMCTNKNTKYFCRFTIELMLTAIFRVCARKVRSLLNPLKFTVISDRAKYRHIDLLALTGTWIMSSSHGVELFNTAPGFTLIIPCTPSSNHSHKSHIVGGGNAFLIREPATLLYTPIYTQLQIIVTLKLFSSNLTVFIVYLPSPATTKLTKLSR